MVNLSKKHENETLMSLFWCIIIYGDIMENKLRKIVNILKDSGKTISTMESCTGGAIVNAITNVPGASSILDFSAVTYSNDFKIKMGVDKDIIDKYTVYSKETAREMAKAISDFTLSNYGIGITGKLGKRDPKNKCGNDNQVFMCIYDKDISTYIDFDIFVDRDNRRDDKKEVLEEVVNKLLSYLEK